MRVCGYEVNKIGGNYYVWKEWEEFKMKWYESIFFGAIGGLIFEIVKYLIGG